MNCHRSLLWLLTLPLLFLAGCQAEEAITEKEVPHSTLTQRKRLLGAIIPQKKGGSWFFKFDAPVEVSAAYEKAFRQLIDSVQLEDQADAKPTWQLPEGWKEEKAAKQHSLRYATLHFGPNHHLELTVSNFEGSVLANLNRWLGQVGQGLAGSIEQVREQKWIEEVKIHGRDVVLVDIVGPGGTPGGMPMQ